MAHIIMCYPSELDIAILREFFIRKLLKLEESVKLEGFPVNWEGYIGRWVLVFLYFSTYGARWEFAGSMLALAIHVILTFLA